MTPHPAEQQRASGGEVLDERLAQALTAAEEHFSDRSWLSLTTQLSAEIIGRYSAREQAILSERLELLNAIGRFFGSDFKMPVRLNEPGKGWAWDEASNTIFVDPQYLLHEPFSKLRFITAHEGGHRRLSRKSVFHPSVAEDTAFFLLANTIEDPRVNNFVCEAYPQLRRDMLMTYLSEHNVLSGLEAQTAKKLHRQPDIVLAVGAYLAHWFESLPEGVRLPMRELPPQVQACIDRTAAAASLAWNLYPSKEEAEASELMIAQYARASHDIVRTRIWPEFKKLLENDIASQAAVEAFKESPTQPSKLQQKGRPGAKAGTTAAGKTAQQRAAGQPPKQGQQPANGSGKDSQGSAAGKQKSDAGASQSAAAQGGQSGAAPSTDSPPSQSGSDKQGGVPGGAAQGTPASSGDALGAPTAPTAEGEASDAAHHNATGKKPNQNDVTEQQDNAEARSQFGEAEADPIREAETGLPPQDPAAGTEGAENGVDPVKEHYDTLPPAEQARFRSRAERLLRELSQELAEQLSGRLGSSPTPEEPDCSEERVPPHIVGPGDAIFEILFEGDEDDEITHEGAVYIDYTSGRPEKSVLERGIVHHGNEFFAARKMVLPLLDQLENELRQIFRARRASKLLAGRRSGSQIDVERRISEIAKGIPPTKTQAFERRDKPREKDYALQLLVDLSGSMRGDKIDETFKAVVLFAEVFHRLSIRTEILGFNDRLYEYKQFHQRMSDEVRTGMGRMLREVCLPAARWNDDGWALTCASARLARQRAAEKFLIVLSDGAPEPSPGHRTQEYELARVVNSIRSSTDQKLIGFGIGPYTHHVRHYYPNSIAGVSLKTFSKQLKTFLRDVIERYDTFKR